MDAGQQLDQRRLAGAVLADDRVDLAFFESQVDGFQRMGCAETLVELFEDEDRRAGVGRERGRIRGGREGHGLFITAGSH